MEYITNDNGERFLVEDTLGENIGIDERVWHIDTSEGMKYAKFETLHTLLCDLVMTDVDYDAPLLRSERIGY